MDDEIKKQFESKRDARSFGRQLRASWDGDTLRNYSGIIAEHLVSGPLFRKASRLLTYVGARPGELDTRPIITAALAHHLEVLVPVTRAAGAMDWARLESLSDLRETRLGLLEPPGGSGEIALDTNGLCIVPGMLFRYDGHRLGFGGGYYDRFLGNHRGETVGLCPARCLGHQFPVETHDISVGWLGTEEGIIAASGPDA